jgi:hypothetical protein
VPVYPGATVLNSMSGEKQGIQSGVYTFQTSDSTKQVLDFYRDRLKGSGFTTSSENSVADQVESMSLSKDDRAVAIVVTHQGDKTTVVVTYGAK